MKRDLARVALHAGYLGSLLPAALGFERALRDPARTQQGVLTRLLRKNAGTAFGIEHGFSRVTSIADFQRRVPIRDYTGFAPYIECIVAGERAVLTETPVRMLERTSGSTSGDKLIPYTPELLNEFSAATNAWILSAHRRHKGLLATTSYWSVSPAAREPEDTVGGLPIGFNDDTEYFGPITRWALSRMLAVPGRVARIRDIDIWRKTTLLGLLNAGSLGLISVWNPSFLTLLMEAIERDLSDLLAALPAARSNQIQRAFDRCGKLTGEAIWPSLRVISLWTDASAAAFVPGLRRWFETVCFEPKGLLATEGVVSVPYSGGEAGAELAVTSHFLEFVPVDDLGAQPLLAHELSIGSRYSPLLTTGGGLYRYHLKDVITVISKNHATPRIRFEGKLDRSSDLCGEKLTESQVASALREAEIHVAAHLDFALLAPSLTPRPHYALFVESSLDDLALADLARHVDSALSRSHHYKYCRDLGQLAPLRAVRVFEGLRRFQAALNKSSARLGHIKPTRLDRRTEWEEWLSVDDRDDPQKS